MLTSVRFALPMASLQALGPGPWDDTEKTWVAVHILQAGPNTITVDLTNTGGKAYAIRYAWQVDGPRGAYCCTERSVQISTLPAFGVVYWRFL